MPSRCHPNHGSKQEKQYKHKEKRRDNPLRFADALHFITTQRQVGGLISVRHPIEALCPYLAHTRPQKASVSLARRSDAVPRCWRAHPWRSGEHSRLPPQRAHHLWPNRRHGKPPGRSCPLGAFESTVSSDSSSFETAPLISSTGQRTARILSTGLPQRLDEMEK